MKLRQAKKIIQSERHRRGDTTRRAEGVCWRMLLRVGRTAVRFAVTRKFCITSVDDVKRVIQTNSTLVRGRLIASSEACCMPHGWEYRVQFIRSSYDWRVHAAGVPDYRSWPCYRPLPERDRLYLLRLLLRGGAANNCTWGRV